MTADFRSNIFGVSTGSSSTLPNEVAVAAGATDAAKLIEHIKWIAETNIVKASDAFGWLGVAADAGQNEGSKSLVRYSNEKPDHITTANVFKDWTTPAMPVLPVFPTLPADLNIDITLFKTGADALVDKLKTMWISSFIPATTDASKYDTLFKDILNGTGEASAKATLDALHTELKSALSSTMLGALAEVNTQVTTLKANIAARVAALDPKIAAAIAEAKLNTSDIAWARARDQVAREGARQEAEVISDWAAHGFAMPGGVLTAQQAAIRQATMDASSKIAAEEAIRTQDMNIDLSKVGIEAFIRTSQFQLQADLESMKAPLEARMRYAAMEMDANREKAKQAFDHLGLRLDFSKFAGEFALKYRVSAMEGMNNLVNAYANLTRNEADYYTKIADAKRQALTALIDYHRLSLAQAEMGIKVSLANNEGDLKWAQTAGDFIVRSVMNHINAAMAVGDSFAKIAASALGGINGIASSADSSSS